MTTIIEAERAVVRDQHLETAPKKPSNARSWMKGGAFGLADQVLISGTNFVTMVLLARGLAPEGFGEFILVYTLMLLANGFQSSLIIQPHHVLGATRKDDAYRDYTATIAFAQVMFAGACALLALIAAGIAIALQWPVAPLLIALVPTIAAWQMQEFVRRVLYTEGRMAGALVNDVVSYGGQTLLIAALAWSHLLTGSWGLYAIAITSAAAALLGLWQVRASLRGKIRRASIVESWHFSKWLLGAEVGYWMSSQIYLYLTGWMLGPSAAGIMKAGYVIFGPTRIIGFFLRTVLPTWFAKTLADGGKLAMHDRLRLVYAASLPILGGYSLLAAIFAGPLLQLLYGERYAGHANIVVLYAVFAFVAFLASVVSAAIRAQRRTRHIFTTQITAMLSLPIGWLMIAQWGVEGAVLGMIMTSLINNFSLWRAYLREANTASVAAEKAIGDA